MVVQIRAKDVELTEEEKTHIENGIETFKKYSLDITRVVCNVVAEKVGVMVEFEIHVAHTEPIIITERDKDVHVAVDIAVNRANKALRRLHDKVKSHRNVPLKEIEIVDA